MKRLAVFFLFSLLAFGPAEMAQGQAAGVFARLGFGARGMAMSNALVADASGAASPYYNPALAPFATGQNIEATAGLLSFDRELQFLQFATPLQPRAGIAVGLIHAGVSNIDGRDNSGFHTQDYAIDEFAFFLAFGTRLGERVTAGVGLQLFRADHFEGLDPVTSIGLDVGLTARVTDALHLGLAVDDLLARYSWDTSALYGEQGKTTSDRFPVRMRVGAAYRLMDGRARLLAEYESRVSSAELRTREIVILGSAPREVSASERLRLHDSRLRVGGEYRLAEAFTLRAGIDRLLSGGLEEVAPSAGFMVEQLVGNLRVQGEYGVVLEPYASGTMHLVTLRVFL